MFGDGTVPPLKVYDLLAIPHMGDQLRGVDLTLAELRTVSINGRAFLIPGNARYIRLGDIKDGVWGIEYQQHERLEGPPSPCGLVDFSCDRDDDYWLLRTDLLDVTVWIRAEEVKRV